MDGLGQGGRRGQTVSVDCCHGHCEHGTHFSGLGLYSVADADLLK